jgi:hypothetical protein
MDYTDAFTPHDYSFHTSLDDWHFESTEVREFYQVVPLRKFSDCGDLLDLPLAEVCSTPSISTQEDSLVLEDFAEEHRPAKRSEPLTWVPVLREFIGPLTQQQRQDKLKRYLDKKQRRVWAKRIKYDCRKKVADSRVRIKGRFVSKAKAEEFS